MNIVLFGPPGAGKGTLAGRLKIILTDHAHISTGDIFRENIKNQTPIGKEAKQYIDAGRLVPDEVTVKMVEERLSRPDCETGFMLDGFPRTIEQARALDGMTTIDRVIEVTATQEQIVDRIVNRVSCPKCGEIYNLKSKKPEQEGICDKCGAELVHRSDDTEETIVARLNTYETFAKPVLAFYKRKGYLVQVDGSVLLDIPTTELETLLRQKPIAEDDYGAYDSKK